MILDKLQVSHFRNIDDLSLSVHKSLNVFIGENGSGKSSILEALHYLGFARSFRTQKHKNVISHEKSGFTVFCSTVVEDGRQQKFGISRHIDDRCVVNINGWLQSQIQLVPARVPKKSCSYGRCQRTPRP